jgi:hypothetical protein
MAIGMSLRLASESFTYAAKQWDQVQAIL